MRIGGFPPGWTEDRRPLADEEADAMRRARYWEWMGGLDGPPAPSPGTCLGASSDGREWHRVEDAAQADREAFFMQHSVGHSWDHYSAMGELLSLRRDDVPEVTVLVSRGVVVHARRARNEPLSAVDLDTLRAYVSERGWRMSPPELL